MSGDGHHVTVIVATLGRQTIAKCQAGLRAQTRPPDEVIVVLDEARRGISWARNEGLRRAHGDLIAFTDDDCVPPPGWLAALIGAIDAHQAAGAGGDMIESDPFLHEVRRRRNRLAGQTSSAAGNGANIMYCRSWLEACEREDGYVFNEHYRHASEDGELAWRLRRRGATLITVAEHVVHLRRATLAAHLRHQFGRGMGIAQMYLAQRRARTSVLMHDSLLWGRAGVAHRPKLAAILWQKVLGPFDASSFSRPAHFWLFWLGEKSQGLGFVWGLLSDLFETRWKRGLNGQVSNLNG